MKFPATIWISYNLQIQKRIVSAETIHGNTVSSNLEFKALILGPEYGHAPEPVYHAPKPVYHAAPKGKLENH